MFDEAARTINEILARRLQSWISGTTGQMALQTHSAAGATFGNIPRFPLNT